MNFLDVRTVVFSQLITDAVCAAVLVFLWLQNRKRFAGTFFWVADFGFQTIAILLIVLRGGIPAWLSIGFINLLIVGGALLGYLGLVRFIGKRASQVHNYGLLALFTLAHEYFAFIHPSLEARDILISLGLLVICFQCAWLMLRGAGRGQTRMTRVVGWVFAFFCLTSLLRIFVLLVSPDRSNDFFQSGFYDTLVLLTYQVLLILLAFSLTLMVNLRLLAEAKTQEEKLAKVFHSSPDAILITRFSDGLILDVNRRFEEILGYPPSEAIGKTTLSLPLWVKETDRREVVAELSARGEVRGREFQFQTKANREMTGQFYAEILVVNDEQIILSNISDITERKQADEIRRESEGRYRSLFENMLNGFAYCQMIFDGDLPQDFIYLDVNRAFETLTGLKDVIGKRVSEVIPGIRESDPVLIETYGRVALTGKPEVFETYVEALKMWFSISVYGLEKGFFVAVFDVISERKLAEEKLRQDEARLHLALDAAKGGAWEWNLETNENIWSEELWKVYGLEPHSCEPSYEAWLQTVHPDDREAAARAVQDAARDSAELYAEWRTLDRDGTERWLMSRGQPILDADGQAARYIGTVLDITERKRGEEALLASEGKYRHTLDAMLEGCQILGFDWRYLYLNDAADIQNRRPKEELLGRRYMDMWPGVESTEVFAVIRRCMEGRQPQSMLNEFEFPDGGKGWFDLKIYPMPEGIVIFSIDITEIKRTEEDLRERENQYRELVQNANSAILRWGRDGRILFFNEYAQKFFGYTAEEALGRNVNLLVPETESTGNDLSTLVQDIIAHPENFVNQINENICRDGRRVWMAWTNKPILDQNGQMREILAIGMDITDRKRAENEIEVLARFPSENPNPVMRTARDGNLLYANEAAFRLLAAWEMAVGKPAPEALKGPTCEAFETQTTVTIDVTCGERFFTFSIAPAPENKYVNLYGRDITDRKRAEEALQKSELLLRALFELSPDAIVLIDPHDPDNKWPIIDCNASACLMNGYERDELIGQSIDIMNANPYSEPDRDAYLKNLQEAGNLKLEVFHRHKNGTIFPVEVSTKAIRVGERELLIGIDRDITERKQAEEALRQSETNFRALAENAGEGILIAGEGGVHLFANPASAEITGYSVEELLHLNASELAHPDEAPNVMERLQKRLAGDDIPAQYETAILSKRGLKVPVEISSNKTTWKGRSADIVFIQNITARKRAEQELQNTLEELTRSNSELEQFAYVASHDLQEPLRMVSSYVQLLERRYKGKLDQDADEFIDFAVDGAERMQKLINDLLTYSRVGTRGQPFAPTACESVLSRALENLQLTIQENKAEVTHDPLPEVLADDTQLVQLFQNLVSNAIKFHGKKKPRVHISAEDNSKEWLFSVRDNGIGIDPQYAERIFIIFQRLNSREKYAGTGIGLAICKKIVQRHGGRIWVESQPGQGATFYFTLPNRRERP